MEGINIILGILDPRPESNGEPVFLSVCLGGRRMGVHVKNITYLNC